MRKFKKGICVRCGKHFLARSKNPKYCSRECVRKLQPKKTHGEAGKSLLYHVWGDMKQRCYNPKNPCYKYYGKVGVEMCEDWRKNYLSFKKFMIDNGYKKGLQIDRINPWGNYEPSNCRVVTRIINARNKKKSERIKIFGEEKIVSEWILDKRCKTSHSSLWHRIKRGWKPEEAMTTPLSFIRK